MLFFVILEQDEIFRNRNRDNLNYCNKLSHQSDVTVKTELRNTRMTWRHRLSLYVSVQTPPSLGPVLATLQSLTLIRSEA